MSSQTRSERIAILLAGVETPSDLTEQEQRWHREDLLVFLQESFEAAQEDEEE